MVDLDLGCTRKIILICHKEGVEDVRQIAYILATACWETARTMEPVRETLADSDEEAIARLDRAFSQGRLPQVSSPYWRDGYFGRGFVQLTHRHNYARVGDELGLELVENPSLALKPDVAARILVRGMMDGWFTGRSLPMFVNNDKADYINARRVVNGTDKAVAIASLASEYEWALRVETGETPPNLPTLYSGMKNPRVAVMLLQKDLSTLGYFSGKLDGLYGPLTRQAVLAFQSDNGLVPDGVVGPATWSALDKAKPRPARVTTENDLRAAGSETIAEADRVEAVAKRGAAIGIAGVSLETVLNAADVVQQTEGAMGALTRIIVDNWPALLAIVAVAGAAVYVTERAKRIRKRRVTDHINGAHIGR